MDPSPDQPGSAEEARRDGPDATRWRRWGPYLAERAWGSVREDYSEDGDAWISFPHDHARSRAYRWNEDGLAGWCDADQHLCVALSLWNGVDPILKERFFGLTNGEGNHGEDVKEAWWYLDATPTASWLRWRYHYPQRAFPYVELIEANAARGRDDDEFELTDTNIFEDDRYWAIDVTWAKDGPDDACLVIEARNAGPEPATLHVLPTMWFRNTWSWRTGVERPVVRDATDTAGSAALHAKHPTFGSWWLTGEPGRSDGSDDGSDTGPVTVLVCDNDTNTARLYDTPTGESPTYPKDGIGDAVIHGVATVNPVGIGTKGALHHTITAAAGETVTVRLRFGPSPATAESFGAAFDTVITDRQREADEFYDSNVPQNDPERAMVARRAFAGLVWSRQFYNYNVVRWLDGDPAEPAPPAAHVTGRNARWRHLNAHEVLAMPDAWEYPWFASWDHAFHAVATAHIDPVFAKNQLLLLGREWYQHPNGAFPAYEWNFDDVNPPVQAWAARQVFLIDGSRDVAFLERVFHKLLLNFTWWVNREDHDGTNAFEGGFLGMDNVGAFNRSAGPPGGGELVQADGTAWMAMYCLDMLQIALELATRNPVYEDLATKFLEHFAAIADAVDSQGLWDDDMGFFHDVVRPADGGAIVPVPVRSISGLVPLFAVSVVDASTLDDLTGFTYRERWFLEHRPESAPLVSWPLSGNGTILTSVLTPERLRRILRRVLDPEEFLSPHGIRSLSKAHGAAPAEVHIGDWVGTVDYEPGPSRSGLFGGNSNWRGPVWLPVNRLVISALRRFARHLGDEFTVEFPTGSGDQATLGAVADDLSRRIVGLFVDDASGRRPCFGDDDRFQRDPAWHEPLFNEYFHGDTGAGLGASHQTGWTALVADLIVGDVAD